MWALNLGKPVNVPQLNETMAIELGANLLGEVIIFSIGAGLLIFEYVRWVYKNRVLFKFKKVLTDVLKCLHINNVIRQVNKETKKEEMVLQEKAELMNTLRDLALQLERQDAQIREMNRVVADLGNTVTLKSLVWYLGQRL